MVKMLGVLIVLVVLSGCAKHGMAIHTGKDFKGTIGVIDADIVGELAICIPSESALNNEMNENWCQQWMSQPKGE